MRGSTFMSILMQHKSELEFLNSIFSFLQRRTKYFHPDNKGAEDNFESLIEVLRHQKMQVTRCPLSYLGRLLTGPINLQLSQPQQPASQPAKPKPKPKPKVKAKVEAKPQVQPQPQPNAQTGSAVEVTAPEQAGATETTISEPPAEGDADDDVPRKKLVGNGGSTDKYTWVQTLSDVTVSVHVPPGAPNRCSCTSIFEHWPEQEHAQSSSP
eukprot:COSAG05_NODE_1037_length_6076_cov_6.031621_6_plen_211_part_00